MMPVLLRGRCLGLARGAAFRRRRRRAARLSGADDAVEDVRPCHHERLVGVALCQRIENGTMLRVGDMQRVAAGKRAITLDVQFAREAEIDLPEALVAALDPLIGPLEQRSSFPVDLPGNAPARPPASTPTPSTTTAP